jgi:hypothetical protein
MIVTRVQKHSNQPKVIGSLPSVDTETTTPGIRVSQDDISMCAYYLYQKRGGEHGHDAEDWVEAERRIAQR